MDRHFFYFVIATLSVFLDIETRPLRPPVLVGISDSGLNSLGRNVGRCGEVVGAFYYGSVRSFPADRHANDHSDPDEDQRCRAFKKFRVLLCTQGE